jgi:chaperonin GroEL (HSP60 family)
MKLKAAIQTVGSIKKSDRGLQLVPTRALFHKTGHVDSLCESTATIDGYEQLDTNEVQNLELGRA